MCCIVAEFTAAGAIHMSAIAGIDQALWNIKGKALGVSVQYRDRMRIYSWIGGDRGSDLARNALEVVDRSFTALKMNGTEELQIVDEHGKIDAILANMRFARRWDQISVSASISTAGCINGHALARSWSRSSSLVRANELERGGVRS
jgi:hypothetical protein